MFEILSLFCLVCSGVISDLISVGDSIICPGIFDNSIFVCISFGVYLVLSEIVGISITIDLFNVSVDEE
jgi:hypothetical protein